VTTRKMITRSTNLLGIFNTEIQYEFGNILTELLLEIVRR